MLNLPQTVTASTTPAVNITYTYDADGNKLRKVSSGSPTDYISGIQYKPDAKTIDFIQTEEGRAINTGGTSYNYEFTLTDHLGNNRVTFDIVNGKVGEDDYYPFGLNVHRLVNGTNLYLYNKKELQPEITEYDYGFRFLDPVVVHWNTIDPLAEESRRFSPYNYAENNPIRNIDPDGRSTEDWLQANGLTQNDLINVYTAPADNNERQEGGDGGKGDKKKKTTSQNQTTVKSVVDDLPVLGKADQAGDELAEGQYGNAALDEGSAILEALMFVPGEAADAGISLWDSFTGLFTKKEGSSIAYHSVSNGVTTYVGITDNFARREAEHLATKGINIQPLMKKLTRADARSVEQVLIEIHGLGSKPGGTLLNKINSIASSNPIYGASLKRGYQLLRSIGYH
jgi:RHS repeat-associated protein